MHNHINLDRNNNSTLLFLGGIALAVQVIPPIATHFSVVRSVCLSHACPLLKLFHGFRCHSTGTRVKSTPVTHCVRWGPLIPRGKGRFGGQTPSQNMQLLTVAKPPLLCYLLAITIEELDGQFHLLPNYFVPCYY